MIEFKPATRENVGLIEQLARKTWPKTFGTVMPSEQIVYMLDLIYNKSALIQQMESGHTFILIQFNNESIGFSSYELNYKEKPQLMIHKIYLIPESQGLGIGKTLFDYLTHVATQNNQKKFILKVFHENKNAIGFYEKKGFKSIGTETTDMGNNCIILDNVMSKIIS